MTGSEPVVRCPLCSARAADGARECLSCGVVFAKLREKRERERKAAESAASLPPPSPPPPDPARLRLAACFVVALWLLGFGLYYRGRTRGLPRTRRPRPEATPAGARLLDPATGRLERVDVHSSPAFMPADVPGAPPLEPPPPPGVPPRDPDFDD